ncbi:glycoside hydrolase family 18 protein [Cysteiniphilum halobium]|uniref:glycoside hydrolase family 18 protein n=1 Tax=Cysteiniphilum halobium TaxID=2219059 RepID=UPI000E65DD82|nr:glycoside hydrolase family 18 protein [Cysteiniphilum halobium]
MKKTLSLFLGSLLATHAFALTANNKVIAGYLDVTATGSALQVNMKEAASDGYNMVIFGFAKVNGTVVSSYDQAAGTTMKEKLAQAKAAGMQTIISFGGASNTFNPGILDSTQIETLAQNMVDFVKVNGFDGIDFDLEIKTDPIMLRDLVEDIKRIDQNIMLTAAPQINNNALVTTGSNEDYQAAVATGDFTYLFLQEYNTIPENNINFISNSFYDIKQQVPSTTKLVIGEPTAAVAASNISLFHSGKETLTTPEVTAKMLNQLKKINMDPQYGGVMGWSLNVDYAPSDFSDPNHIPGSYAYGLKNCVLNNQCDHAPSPEPTVPNYTLQVSNLDPNIGVTFHIVSIGGNAFTSDYTAPNQNHVYSATTPVSAASIEGKKELIVRVDSYSGGPSFTCPKTFNLTQNTNVMVNVTTQSCAIKTLP